MSDHLASIDVLRVVLCVCVVAYHVVEESASLFPERGAPWERSAVISFIYLAAPPAVDVFLMLAGCFSARGCARIADGRGRWSRYAARIFSRWRRLATMHGVVILAAWLLGDGRYFPGGRLDVRTFDWLRVAATFGWKNYYRGWEGWYDLAAVPLWSNYVDLHGTSLIVLLSACLGGLEVSLAAAAAVASAAVRWAVIQRDPSCLDEGCLDLTALATLFTTPGDAGAPGNWLGAAPLVRGGPHCPGCPGLDAAAWVDHWGSSLYVPTHARLAPLFVGAALAAALKNAAPTPPMALHRALVLGLALLWAAEAHGLVDLTVRSRVAAMLGAQALDALGGLLTATAWAVLVFASIAPEGHWLQLPALRVAASPALRRISDTTFYVYCLHWPVLMVCLRSARAHGLPASDALAFGMIFAPTLLGAIALATAYDAVLAVLVPAPPSPVLRRSSSVLSGWESE